MQRRIHVPRITLGSLAVCALAIGGLIACERSPQATTKLGAPDTGSAMARGPDPVLLRIPRTGGQARAYLYPRLDSAVWSGTGSPITQVLGFDPEGGTLAIINGKGQPARIDLRFGEASVASTATLTNLTSPNGADIYGIDPKGAINRMTRVNSWTFVPPAPAKAVFPQLDGSIIIVAQVKGEVRAWRVRPPVDKVLDTLALPLATLPASRAQVGDRIYFGTDSGLVGFRTRTMERVPTISFKSKVTALTPTPSGDRMYVTSEQEEEISVIDRYTDRISGTIELPGPVVSLRMDPLGRYVLAKPARGDSAWVIAVATDRVIGSVRTRWTEDLPACAPDGAIAVSVGEDVVFMDGETLQPLRTIASGTKDYWYFVFWNGFRPRAAGIDEPVSFGNDDSLAADGSASDDPYATPYGNQSPAYPGSGTIPPPPASTAPVQPAPSLPPPPARSAPPAPPIRQTYSVSFAALLNEAKARQLADSVIVNGVRARVVPSQRAGTTVYRVILGPYPSRAAAEQVGNDSNRQYWIYTGEP